MHTTFSGCLTPSILGSCHFTIPKLIFKYISHMRFWLYYCVRLHAIVGSFLFSSFTFMRTCHMEGLTLKMFKKVIPSFLFILSPHNHIVSMWALSFLSLSFSVLLGWIVFCSKILNYIFCFWSVRCLAPA